MVWYCKQAAVVLRETSDGEARPRHVATVMSLCVPDRVLKKYRRRDEGREDIR